MKHSRLSVAVGAGVGCIATVALVSGSLGLPPSLPLSPSAVVATKDGKTLYVVARTARQVLVVDTKAGKVTRGIAVPPDPTGLALSADGATLYVTSAAPASPVSQIAAATGKVTATITVGHSATAPVLAPDGKTLYVCNRFNNNVGVIDLAAKKQVACIPVLREPDAAAITPDGKRLVVANLLPVGRADVDVVAAAVSIIDTTARSTVANVALPNGSMSLRGVAVSPDGKYAYIAHLLGRFHMPTTQLERGWMNTNAMSIIDVAKAKLVNTVLLDNVDRGAANPWGIATTADGKKVCVTHAGTHELSVIDIPKLMDKLAKLPDTLDPKAQIDYSKASRIKEDVPNDLSFLVDLRRRIRLKGNGPRGVAVVGKTAYVTEYFTDTLSVVEFEAEYHPAKTQWPLGSHQPMTVVRKGEMFFHDASLCFQGWQSCSSCHPDARADGLNWDLMNDGMGNPKNTRNMLLAHKTPPAMSLGVRDKAEQAVRAGIRFIQFAVRPEEDAVALDEYLKSLKPVPSPYLVDGKLSPAAERGKRLFLDAKVGCAHCHPPGLLSNQKQFDVGTKGKLDKDGESEFDTPTLVEVWRTAPYLHDGQCATIQDVLVAGNRGDKHGKTSHLSKEQIADLAAFVLSQ